MINLYYDNIFEGNPVPNCTKRWELSDGKVRLPVLTSRELHSPETVIKSTTTFYNAMRYYKVKVNLFTGKQTAKNLFYPVELNGMVKRSIYKAIPPKTLSKIKKKKMKLLLLWPEGGVGVNTMWDLKATIGELHGKDVPQEQICLVTSELNGAYKSLLKGIDMYAIDWWQIATQLTYKSRYGDEDLHWITREDTDNPLVGVDKNIEYFDIDNWDYKNRKKLFVSYTGKESIQNTGLVSELIKRDLFDSGYVSYKLFEDTYEPSGSELQRIIDYRDSDSQVATKEKIIKKLADKKYVVDYDGKTFDRSKYKFRNAPLYGSAFSIISEKFVPFYKKQYLSELNALHVTSTTWRHVAMGHPFLVLGCVNTMGYLNNEGYFSLTDMIEESYDRISDLTKKIDAMCKQVERLSKLSDEHLNNLIEKSIPFLKENKRRFYYRDHKEKFLELFREMAYE